MKTILKTLQKNLIKIEDKCTDRECYYDERSEKWQESEKAQEYEEKTDKLNEVRDNLEMTIESLEKYLDN